MKFGICNKHLLDIPVQQHILANPFGDAEPVEIFKL